MAVSAVKVTINGVVHALSFNSSSGAYEGIVAAPSKSSYNQQNKYYDISISAYDDAGNSTTVNSASDVFGEDLKLYVQEKVAPTISILSPTNDAVLGSNKPTISWACYDEDSGVDKDSIELYLDGIEVSGTISASLSSGTYTCSYVPDDAIADGIHTLKFSCSDNDGNSAEKSISVTVDTVPPTLNVSLPANNLKTNVATVTVSGTTNDLTSSPVILTVNDNEVNVNSNGSFSTTIPLNVGENIITIVSTDGAGKSTTVTRTVYYDNTAPTINSISIVPNPVDAGKTFVISVNVTD